ncbi:MAG TPA: gluconokinase [Pyrinomonadaceae bacterium]|nr:gluconokinase [Pyrinomonadaceae bacterium]
MKQPLILALDIGTSSVRSALYDGQANAVPRAFVKIERTLTVTTDGGAEIDADEAVAQVAAAIDALLEKTTAHITHIASCSFWHSLVGVDAKGKPTTKVFGWADTRSGKYTEVLKKRFDENETHNRTGAHFHSSFWPAKLLWLRKDFPDVFVKTERWLSFSDYVALKLFGTATTSVSMASGTGIFDIRKCDWDPELLKFLKVKAANLPAMVANDSDTFTLNKKCAKRWPRLAHAKWFLTVADGATDNIGAGCFTNTQAALMVGTSGAMRVAYEAEPPGHIPEGLWCYRVNRKMCVLGGALSDGGNLAQWMRDNLRLGSDADDVVRQRLGTSSTIKIAPFFNGERSTGYNESATGAIIGLTAAHDAYDIYRAAMEAVAYRFADILRRLETVFKIEQIIASGGALRESPVWTEIISKALNRELTMSEARESSSRGAVLLALESLGRI